MPVDTPRARFHNRKVTEKHSKERQKPQSLERALEEAVSRALRDNLAPLQRTADELHQAYADLVAACSSSRPSNALPAMLRAQTAASALAAGLSVLSNFVAVALNPPERRIAVDQVVRVRTPAAPPVAADAPSATQELPLEAEPAYPAYEDTPEANVAYASVEPEIPAEPLVPEPVASQPEFDLTSFSAEIQDLH